MGILVVMDYILCKTADELTPALILFRGNARALSSHVLVGHCPALAPAPGQTSPNLSRKPSIRAYVPNRRLLASGGGRGANRWRGEW